MDPIAEPFDGKRRAPRVGFDLLVRCSHGPVRSTVMLKDMTRYGARIEGIASPEIGEAITLMLPGEPPRMAFVMWTRGTTSGLEFGDPLHAETFDAMIRDFAIGRQPGAPDIASAPLPALPPILPPLPPILSPLPAAATAPARVAA